MLGLDALPAYKRVVAWFPDPVNDTERYFLRIRRLNRGLDTDDLRVYKRREEPSAVRLVLSMDTSSVTVRLITPLMTPCVLHWSSWG
jgi:hypothetical protein